MAKKIEVKKFKKQVLSLLAKAAYAEYKRWIPSKTLRRALTIHVQELGLTEDEAALNIPHYWARWLHDGHGIIRPRDARMLIWFDRPQDDPRWSGRHPVKASDVAKLKKSEFLRGLRINALRKKQGRRPYMYVRETSPAQDGTRWFESPFRLRQTDENAILKTVDKFVRSYSIRDQATAYVKFTKSRA